MSLKINKQQFNKWIAALDSGEYEQGTYRLQDGYSYCCLGVACKVAIPEGLQRRKFGVLMGLNPGNQPAAPTWLLNIDMDFLIKTGRSLSWLNDGMGFTFPEIATLLELVYIHKILD